MSGERKQQILEVLARELETKPGVRLTTAKLAAAVGVSEAALYRHFPSKARMFEALIEFAEAAVFGLINQILATHTDPAIRCAQMGTVLLQFAERNPGITRILIGDILLGEHERLRQRVTHFFERFEMQVRQVLRDATLVFPPSLDPATVTAAANLLAAVLMGRIGQFVRSGFRILPTPHWEDQWSMLVRALFREPSALT